ncbi:DoxX protein [bacterium]|nr:MAG: DoxX protein [bacterium]
MTPDSPAIVLCRWLLALLLIVFGANGILRFLPVPKLPARAEAFRRALADTAYMTPLWKAVEFFAAALLMLDLWVPFALVLLAPVLINILCFHFFLARKGLPLAALLVVCEALLAWAHRHAFASLFGGA